MKKTVHCLLLLFSVLSMYSCVNTNNETICLSDTITVTNNCDTDITVEYSEYSLGADIVYTLIGCDTCGSTEEVVVVPARSSRDIEAYFGSCTRYSDGDDDCDEARGTVLSITYHHETIDYPVFWATHITVEEEDFGYY
jgi:hypothetical protein